MSASLDTLNEAAQYDAERAMAGIPDQLVLYKTTPESGYEATASILSGWFPQVEEDRIEGRQYLAVRIAETDENYAVLTPTIVSQLSGLVINNLFYMFQDKRDPFGEPRVWLIKVAPTGEALA